MNLAFINFSKMYFYKVKNNSFCSLVDLLFENMMLRSRFSKDFLKIVKFTIVNKILFL